MYRVVPHGSSAGRSAVAGAADALTAAVPARRLVAAAGERRLAWRAATVAVDVGTDVGAGMAGLTLCNGGVGGAGDKGITSAGSSVRCVGAAGHLAAETEKADLDVAAQTGHCGLTALGVDVVTCVADQRTAIDMGPVSAGLAGGQGIGGAWRTNQTGIIPKRCRRRRIAVAAAAGRFKAGIVLVAARAGLFWTRVPQLASMGEVAGGAVIVILVPAVTDFTDPVGGGSAC